jgi:tetratricopeptide (TPR) repeat protein
MRAYHPMVSAGGGNGQFTDDPADLLPLVFARPRDALAGAHSILAGRPPPHSASIAHQVIGLVERDFGDAAAGVRHLRTAVRLARRSGSPDREGDVLAALGIALIHTGRTADGLRALAAAGTLASGVTAARVRFRLAGALWVLGRHDEALVEVRPAIGALRRAGDTIWAARALTLRGLLQLALGATDRADRDFAAAEQLFTTTSQEHDSAHAVQNRGLAAFRAGDLPGALRHLDAAGHRFQALGTSMPELSLDRCGVLLAAGLARDALAEADRAIARLDRRHGAATRRAELLLSAARAALAAGDPAVAADRAAHAGRLFAAQRRDWWSAHSRLLLLQARLAAGPVTGALAPDAARTAERLAALGSPESAQARLLAGRAALARGSRAEAGRQLAIAARDRRRGPPLTRASGWLAQALLAESAGQDRRALQACGRGLAVLSAHSLTLGATELRAQVTAHGQELAELAQRTCLRTGPPRRLLVWGERWRATAAATTPVHPPDDRRPARRAPRRRPCSASSSSWSGGSGPRSCGCRDRPGPRRTRRWTSGRCWPSSAPASSRRSSRSAGTCTSCCAGAAGCAASGSARPPPPSARPSTSSRRCAGWPTARRPGRARPWPRWARPAAGCRSSCSGRRPGTWATGRSWSCRRPGCTRCRGPSCPR